jgi:hypothetical protein
MLPLHTYNRYISLFVMSSLSLWQLSLVPYALAKPVRESATYDVSTHKLYVATLALPRVDHVEVLLLLPLTKNIRVTICVQGWIEFDWLSRTHSAFLSISRREWDRTNFIPAAYGQLDSVIDLHTEVVSSTSIFILWSHKNMLFIYSLLSSFHPLLTALFVFFTYVCRWKVWSDSRLLL